MGLFDKRLSQNEIKALEIEITNHFLTEEDFDLYNRINEARIIADKLATWQKTTGQNTLIYRSNNRDVIYHLDQNGMISYTNKDKD